MNRRRGELARDVLGLLTFGFVGWLWSWFMALGLGWQA